MIWVPCWACCSRRLLATCNSKWTFSKYGSNVFRLNLVFRLVHSFICLIIIIHSLFFFIGIENVTIIRLISLVLIVIDLTLCKLGFVDVSAGKPSHKNHVP